jgi:CheY-like chemotaxis protein
MTRREESQGTVVQPLVLIVDDDLSVCDALSSLLAPRLEPFYRVETAASADEALELLSAPAAGELETPIALVISDERMPGRSGTDLLIELRRHPLHRDGGRIIITAYAGLPSAERAINEAQVDRYFPKPWNADEELLPAACAILERFARKKEIDRFLLVAPVTGPDAVENAREVRQAWRDYLTLQGGDPVTAGVEKPALVDPEDSTATHILARRLSPREDLLAGSLRLRKEAGDKTGVLDALAFRPEETGDNLESLLLRTAALAASATGLTVLRTEAPFARRDVYAALGFAPGPGSTEAGSSGTVQMQLDLNRQPAEHHDRRIAEAYAIRYKEEQRLCSCAQTACPLRDYTAKQRGYFCPLDLREGRTPPGFPCVTIR